MFIFSTTVPLCGCRVHASASPSACVLVHGIIRLMAAPWAFKAFVSGQNAFVRHCPCVDLPSTKCYPLSHSALTSHSHSPFTPKASRIRRSMSMTIVS